MRPSERDRRFTDYLRGLAHSHAPLPLCRWRHDPNSPLALRLFGRWTEGLSAEAAAGYRLVAALFAVHPMDTATGNLGGSLAAVARARGFTPGLERRFIALLDAHRDELPGHLRRLVSLSRSADIPINWAQLLADLRAWSLPDRRVQLAWARAFWASRLGPPEAMDTPPPPYPSPAAVPHLDRGSADDPGVALAAELRALVPQPR